jgi:hypothetical protein
VATPNPIVPTNPNAFGQAGIDLGLGGDLQEQVQDEIMDRRKRALLAANQQPGSFGALGLSGVSGVGNTGGMALQALMGAGVIGG